MLLRLPCAHGPSRAASLMLPMLCDALKAKEASKMLRPTGHARMVNFRSFVFPTFDFVLEAQTLTNNFRLRPCYVIVPFFLSRAKPKEKGDHNMGALQAQTLTSLGLKPGAYARRALVRVTEQN